MTHTDAKLQVPMQVKRGGAARGFCVPHHKRARRDHKQERQGAEPGMHKASKATAAHRSRRLPHVRIRVYFLFPFTFAVPRLGGGNWARYGLVLGCGSGGGARQVELAASEKVVDRDVYVRVRRGWWRGAERPDDVLYSVWRCLQSQVTKVRENTECTPPPENKIR